MLRSLVGSEMCIRDSINAEYGEPSLWYGMSTGHTRPRRSPFDCRLPPSILECGVFSADCPLRGYKRLRMGKQRRLGCGEHRLLWMARSDVYVRPRHSPVPVQQQAYWHHRERCRMPRRAAVPATPRRRVVTSLSVLVAIGS
eukprot:TRINITY_DN8148_c0_g2_i1.p1 TRINITY_DN8148_c0_g2~~TRINITY_DN8148_c0_g2_i1.p1  ORF type:complete len:142 (-),score=16.18 TRINITY_DN8148_c0_g2_i1:446-871(-)